LAAIEQIASEIKSYHHQGNKKIKKLNKEKQKKSLCRIIKLKLVTDISV